MSKNIALIIPELQGGGAERVVSNLSLHLSEKYRRYIIVYDRENVGYEYKGILTGLDIKYAATFPGKIVTYFKKIWRLRRIKREYAIQTALSFMDGPNVINILSRYKERVVISVRNFLSKDLKGFYGFIYKLLIRMFYNRADCIAVVSNAIREDMIKNFGINGNKVKVIYNPYDIESIQESAREDIEEEYRPIFDKPVIINVGRLCMQKGQWHLIRAFKKVKEQIPEMKLVILGEGVLEDYLKKLVSDYGLQEDVYFLGFKKNPFKYISRSAIYAFSSLFEGFPNALAEAMACGLPVISSDCKSGPREILAPSTHMNSEAKSIEWAEYGVLVPVCDDKYYNTQDSLTEEEKALAEGIVRLYSSKGIMDNYKLRSLERVECFSIDKIVSEYESIL